MLKPSMQELLNKVGNRYLLVNLAAQRARDIADEADERGESLPDKAVKLALDEIADGSIVYEPGPRVHHNIPIVPASDLSGTLDLDLDLNDDLIADETAENALFEDEDEEEENEEE